jgi:Xaa-Pro aminopeptidase
MSTAYEKRLDSLREAMREAGVDGMLVTHAPNIRYLIGTRASGVLLVCHDESVFITDGRYDAQAHEEVKVAKVRITPRRKGYIEVAAKLLNRYGVRRLGIEAERMSVAQFDKLCDLIRGIKVHKLTSVVEQMRAVKDDEEIELLRKASAIASDALEYALSLIRPGVRERDVAIEVERFIKSSGAEDVAFKLIIASGYRSAMAHGEASEKTIEAGELVVIDLGAVFSGYHSDITRTVAVGKANKRQRDAYSAVLEAQLTAIEGVKPNRTMKQIESLARRKLRARGVERYFKHGIGHGVGLEIHELPSPKGKGGQLCAGCVITVEPGIYFEGFGGVRIEDMVLVKQDGHEVLTRAQKPKELPVL